MGKSVWQNTQSPDQWENTQIVDKLWKNLWKTV